LRLLNNEDSPIDISLKELRRVRRDCHTELKAYPNVLGTAIGRKIIQGEATKVKSIVIYVDKKRKLSKKRSIPRYFDVGGKRVPTDVVECPSIRYQSALNPLFCSDGYNLGTVSAMCRSGPNFFAATCAHNLKGEDANIYTSDPMQLFDGKSGQWIEVGKTRSVFSSDGLGVSGNFGFIDAGLFSIDRQYLIDELKDAKPLPIKSQISYGTRVQAIGIGLQELTGVVIHDCSSFTDFYSDVCIYVDPPGTAGGDSGLLWKTAAGQAVAIHSKGGGNYTDDRAQFSFGMFANRFRDILNVELLNY